MSWADGEFEDAWFGDDRLRQRAIRVCERLGEHPSESIPVACCGRAEVEAAYRFFSNDKVTAARVLGPHHDIWGGEEPEFTGIEEASRVLGLVLRR